MSIRLILTTVILSAMLVTTGCNKGKSDGDKAASGPSLDINKLNEDQKVSYIFGVDFGMRIRRALKFNPRMKNITTNEFIAGIRDAMTKKPDQLIMTRKQMQTVMIAYQRKVIAAERARIAKIKEDGAKFLAAKKKEKGVKAHTSGILYQVIREGKGTSPTLKDRVQVHYTGLRIDGKEFDSSYRSGRPVTFNLRYMIKAWQVILPLMKEGARWKIYVPADHAYGARGKPPRINPHETLVFTIELIKVNPKPPAAATKKVAPKTEVKKKSDKEEAADKAKKEEAKKTEEKKDEKKSK